MRIRRAPVISLYIGVKPNASFDDYPFPAYDLVNLEAYYAVNPYRVLDIEQNRGCALRCSFCYAANHWGQGEQTRSIDRVVEDFPYQVVQSSGTYASDVHARAFADWV